MNKTESQRLAKTIMGRSKIKAGKVDRLEADEFYSKHSKFRVNMLVDLDVLDRLRKIAADKRKPYQTLINEVLRNYVEQPQESLQDRIDALEKFVHKKLG